MKQTVLMYHDVYRDSVKESGFQTDGANHYKISETVFSEQLSLLKGRSITLTFDDGGVSFYSVIAPMLEANGLRGQFYIATDYIGTEGFMTEEQIRDLHQRGHTIGSHSASHPADFRSLTLAKRTDDWKKSIGRLSSILKVPVDEVSVPNGFLQKEDLPMFEQLGIKKIYTSKIGEMRQYNDIQIHGRIGIDKGMTANQLADVLEERAYYRRLLAKQWILDATKMLLGGSYVRIKRIIRKWQK